MATLYEQYTAAGKALPSVQERQGLASQAGIQNYSGTAEQNTALGNYITTNKIDLTKGIDASLLGKTNAAVPPAVVTPATVNAGATLAGVTAGAGIVPTEPKTAKDNYTSTGDAYTKLIETVAGKKAEQMALEASPEVVAQQKAVQDYTNQLNALKAETTATQLGLEGQGRGIPQAIIGGQQNAVERQNAIKALTIGAQLAGAQGNLSLANQNISKAIELKYAPIEAELDTRQAQLEYYKPLMSAEQQAKADEQSILNKIQAEKVAFDREKEMASYKYQLEQKYSTPTVSSSTVSSGTPSSVVTTTAGKPLNDTQATALGYAQRMEESDAVINSFGNKFTGTSSYLGQAMPNALKSSERQQYEQAQRNFVNSVLRKESGAAISETEFDNAKKQYFPQPGDSPETVLQKAQNRQTSINNFYRNANVTRTAQTQLPAGTTGKTSSGIKFTIEK